MYLFGEKLSIVYKSMFLLFIVLASVASAANMLDFTDLLVLAMAFPNLIGLYLLSGKAVSYTHLDVYKRQPLHRSQSHNAE